MESIIVALITGGLSLIGVIITSRSSGKKLQQQLEIAQAVTDTKIVELTRARSETTIILQNVCRC